MRCNASKTKYSALPDTNTGCHDTLRSYPCVRTDIDRLHDQIERLFTPVMAASAKVRALGYADIVSKSYFGQVVNPHIFTNPAMVTHN